MDSVYVPLESDDVTNVVSVVLEGYKGGLGCASFLGSVDSHLDDLSAKAGYATAGVFGPDDF
jgi:hypothetical protein